MPRLFVFLFVGIFISHPAFALLDLPERLDSTQYRQADKLMQQVVQRYERSRKLYNEQGPQAFASTLSDKIPFDHQKEIMQMLTKLPELPTLAHTEGKITFNFESGKTLNFSNYEVVLGKFVDGKYNKRYNFNSSPKENWDSFQQKSKEKLSFLQIFESINFLILPPANAQEYKIDDTAVISVGSVTGVVVLGELFGVRPKSFGAGGGHQ